MQRKTARATLEVEKAKTGSPLEIPPAKKKKKKKITF